MFPEAVGMDLRCPVCGKCWHTNNMVERAAAIEGGLLRCGKGLGGPGEKVHALFATPISAMFAYSKGSTRFLASQRGILALVARA